MTKTSIQKLPCQKTCSHTIEFMIEQMISANAGISIPPYQKTDGYKYINIFTEFEQLIAGEAPVSLGAIFAFDNNGKLGAGCYSNYELNTAGPQPLNFIEADGSGTLARIATQ